MVTYRPIDEVINFITSFPKPEDVLAYKAPESIQKRVEDLLYKKQTSFLNDDEVEEMNKFMLINHIIIMAKKRAKKTLLV
ncbi:hypothetical protein LV89_04062 [Arcicella aurantiaca]|uniref:Uncharacterized protein n=1 Tax=Arcicella aurantiaca TaxID=591202 RepID=A0A316DKU6_9BACT|nr:hypothetical protein [Arcicella aurantiaca]PWK18774.1 hypothetical protein LV89_04062 [Arcicella aurantiaca]